MEYYFNFALGLSETNHTPVTVIGNPTLMTDPVTGYQCCYFDGQSALQLPPVTIENLPFTVSTIFRPTTSLTEAGIFGSNGFRLALRSNRKAWSYSAWANFPSSIDPKVLTFAVSEEQWYQEHQFTMTREEQVFKIYWDRQLQGEIHYPYNYWSVPIYLGYYYDMLYAFTGYMREYRFSLNQVLAP